MELKVYKSLWGMEPAAGQSPADALANHFERISGAGYDGVESAAQEATDPAALEALLGAYKLDYVALVYTEGSDQAEELRRRAGEAMRYEPKKIVAHAGSDTMSFVRQIRFFESALRLEQELGIPIAHETHRRRPLFSPMNTLAILRELPELRINADFSHWCCVTESMLEPHMEAVRLAAERAVHLHGRVGFENGPQVPDPRVEEWQSRVTRHEEWWELIIAAHLERGERTLSFVPEFGPPTYMPTNPATGKPVADLWDICSWSAARFREQFARAMARASIGA